MGVLLLAASLSACNGSDGDGDGDGGMGGGAGGSGGGGGTPADCAPPPGATILHELAPDETGESPVYQIHRTDTHLILAFIDRLVQVPLAGGAPTTLYRSPNELAILRTYQRSNDEIIVQDGAEFSLVSTSTGAATPLAISFAEYPSQLDYDPTTDSMVGRYGAFDAPKVYARVKVGEVGQTNFGDPTAIGGNHLFTLADGEIFLEDDPMQFERVPYRLTIADVAPQLVNLSPASDRLAWITPDFIYYASDGGTEDLSNAGIFRASRAGGVGTRVATNFAFTGPFLLANGNLVSHVADRLLVIPDSTDGAQFAELPIRVTGCTSHGLQVVNGEIYSTLYGSLTGETRLFKVALP